MVVEGTEKTEFRFHTLRRRRPSDLRFQIVIDGVEVGRVKNFTVSEQKHYPKIVTFEHFRAGGPSVPRGDIRFKQ